MEGDARLRAKRRKAKRYRAALATAVQKIGPRLNRSRWGISSGGDFRLADKTAVQSFVALRGS